MDFGVSFEIIFIILSAIAAGALVGLTPGLNPMVGLIMVMPLVNFLSPGDLVIFWLCYSCVVQYYGSVGALLFKVPSETSSIPVLVESQNLKMVRSIIKTYRLTAYSSLVASIISIILLIIIFIFAQKFWYHLFSLKVTIFFLSVLLILLFLNKWQYILNPLLMVVGVFLANYESTPGIGNLCAEFSWSCFLLSPIDITLAMLCLYTVPFLVFDRTFFNKRNIIKAPDYKWHSLSKFFPLSVKHGLIGFLVGFIPGVGVIIGSHLSARVEARKNPANKLKIMAACEAANNSAAISASVPFLFLGLPITATEVYIDNWLFLFKSTTVNFDMVTAPVIFLGITMPLFAKLIIATLTVCVVCYWLTSRFIGAYQIINYLPNNIANAFFKSVIAIMLMLSAWYSPSPWQLTLLTIAIFSSISYICTKHGKDFIALPVTFVLGQYLVGKFTSAVDLISF